MFFRFAAAIGMLTVIALVAIGLEKQNLSLKRAVSLQHYQLQWLQEKRSRLVLQTQELGAPARLVEVLEEDQNRVEEKQHSARMR